MPKLQADDLLQRGKIAFENDQVRAMHHKIKEALNCDSSVLSALNLVYGDRNQTYGPAGDDFARAARIMNSIKDLSDKNVYQPKDILLVLLSVKLARRQFKYKKDTYDDMCGYTELLEQEVRAHLSQTINLQATTRDVFETPPSNPGKRAKKKK